MENPVLELQKLNPIASKNENTSYSSSSSSSSIENSTFSIFC